MAIIIWSVTGAEKIIELTEQEKKDLSLGLLREWWALSTQAFVDYAGSETTLHFIKPHFIHSGKAGTKNFPHATGVEDLVDQGVMNFKRVQGEMLAAMVDGSWGPTYDADDGSGIGVLKGCAIKGVPKEICIACGYMSMETEVIDPSYETRLIQSLGAGDSECQWLVSKKGQIAKVLPIEKYLTPPELQLKPELIAKKDVKTALCHAYLGEMWVMTTRAFIEQAGSEKAVERLRFYMRHSGLSTGIRLSKRLDIHLRKMDSLVYCIQLIQNLHNKKGRIDRFDDSVQCEITECPFSGSPPEICKQYEAFFNGICESIDPSVEFYNERSMTKGAETCYWTIGPKKDRDKKSSKAIEEVPEDPSKILAIRYAKGEISKEELEERMANLKKHGLAD